MNLIRKKIKIHLEQIKQNIKQQTIYVRLPSSMRTCPFLELPITLCKFEFPACRLPAAINVATCIQTEVEKSNKLFKII